MSSSSYMWEFRARHASHQMGEWWDFNQEKSCLIMRYDCHRCTGWWLTYPSEKYEFVSWDYDSQYGKYMAVCQNLVPLVNIKIAGKWMFIPLKIVLIGIDPYPYGKCSKPPTSVIYNGKPWWVHQGPGLPGLCNSWLTILQVGGNLTNLSTPIGSMVLVYMLTLGVYWW